MFTIKGCSLIRGVHYERFHCNVMYSVCTLLIVVKNHCDLSVLAVSLMGLKKKLDRGWVGGLSCIQFVFGFLEFFNFAKPLTLATVTLTASSDAHYCCVCE